MKTTELLLLAVLLAAPAWAQTPAGGAPRQADDVAAPAKTWTTRPLLLPVGGGRGERESARLRPSGIEAATLAVFAAQGSPEERRRNYPVIDGSARIAPGAPQVGNYHWVTMREETPERVKVASTAWFFGNPGPAPADLLAQSRHELEIVPNPLPREHGSYRESEKWRFKLRLHGRPLANQLLTLETEFGTRTRFVSDAAGIATVLFPRDFRAAAPAAEAAAGHARQSARFVLSTEAEADGRHYLTAFNLSYGPDADRGRSLGWGAAFGLLGMLAASPLLRRRAQAASGEPSDA